MAAQKFYNVKKRESVTIDEGKCTKVIYSKTVAGKVQERYAVRAKDDDGTNLTRFMSKKDFDAAKCPTAK
ncbi:MAG TPA: hypothetical protein DD381_11540 [Lentisphaeria bacterium]|nr:MAG: hypothetical protein A2X47_10080 [Lentisphaerae bacterium GWF2_38_69]HBM16961.1 hypothetical protein [Lentisphaeria bacterium]